MLPQRRSPHSTPAWSTDSSMTRVARRCRSDFAGLPQGTMAAACLPICTDQLAECFRDRPRTKGVTSAGIPKT